MEKVNNNDPLFKKGLWNGDIPIIYTVIDYEVGKAPSITWWSAFHLGEIRQGILVKNPADDYEFVIDNKFGDGFFKVTRGGSPRDGHKSVQGFKIVRENVPLNEWVTIPDWEAIRKEDELHDEEIKRVDPIAYERIQSLKRILSSSKKT